MNRFLGTTCFAISLVFCMMTVVWTGVCGDFVSVLYDYCCVDRCLCSLIWFSLICNILCVWARNNCTQGPGRFCLGLGT